MSKPSATPKKGKKQAVIPSKKTSMKSKQVLASTISLPAAREQKLKSAMSVTARPDLSYIRVKGREPIRSLSVSQAFTVVFDEWINPLNPVLFPKLSQEAALYDKWRPVSIKLIYAPRCPTALSGQVGCLILPDVHVSEAPSSMIELDRYEHSFSAAPWTAGECRYTKKYDALTWYFVAPPAEFVGTAVGTDRTQACGVVQLCTSDAASGDIGKLGGTVYIEYDIEFIERRPPYVSAFSNASPPVQQVGTDAPVYSSPNVAEILSSTSSNLFGFPALFTSANPAQLITAVSGATPTYLSSIGALAAVSAVKFLKLHRGAHRLMTRHNFGTVGSTLPVSQRTHHEFRQGGWVSPRGDLPKPTLVRQTCGGTGAISVPRDEVKDESTVYRYLRVDSGGTVWGSNDDSEWTVIPPAPSLGARPLNVELTNNDYQPFWVLYNPVTNTTTFPFNPSVANSASAHTVFNVADIDVSTNYPLFLAPAYLTQCAVGDQRAVDVVVMITARDST